MGEDPAQDQGEGRESWVKEARLGAKTKTNRL